jgi:hypothetical protein
LRMRISVLDFFFRFGMICAVKTDFLIAYRGPGRPAARPVAMSLREG